MPPPSPPPAARPSSNARAAGITQPDYVHLSPGPRPTATLHFNPASPQAGWEALRGWARYRATTVTATETPGRTGTYTARVTWHHDGITFNASAHITAPPDHDQDER